MNRQQNKSLLITLCCQVMVFIALIKTGSAPSDAFNPTALSDQ